MDKPKVGDKIRALETSDLYEDWGDQELTVLMVFDSLDESWDPMGEHAWSQRDVDEETGKTGDWYVIVETQHSGETLSLGSYEVKSS